MPYFLILKMLAEVWGLPPSLRYCGVWPQPLLMSQWIFTAAHFSSSQTPAKGGVTLHSSYSQNCKFLWMHRGTREILQQHISCTACSMILSLNRIWAFLQATIIKKKKKILVKETNLAINQRWGCSSISVQPCSWNTLVPVLMPQPP